jgi:hypothetical protein
MSRALPSRGDQNGARTVCAPPVTGSSGIPSVGAKNRDTKCTGAVAPAAGSVTDSSAAAVQMNRSHVGLLAEHYQRVMVGHDPGHVGLAVENYEQVTQRCRSMHLNGLHTQRRRDLRSESA